MRHLAVAMISLLAWGCASTPDKRPKPSKPEVPFVTSEEPPERVKDEVIAIPYSKLTPEQKDVLDELGVPYDGYVISPNKAMAVAKLRLYADQVYADSRLNEKLGTMYTDQLYDRLLTSEQMRYDEVAEDNTWWARNRDTVYLITGFVVGGSTTILIVYGVNRVSE